MAAGKGSKGTKASKTSKKSRQGPSKSAGPKGAIMHRDLRFDAGSMTEAPFARADLVFEGVDHAQGSYEVRVFLNNKKADDKTARTPESGYAGRFVVFGHGRCFGDEGHCEPSLATTAAPALGPAGGRHPLTPQTKILTITEPLRHVLSTSDKRLKTLTFVPISKAPRRRERGVAAGLFKYGRVSLRTYR